MRGIRFNFYTSQERINAMKNNKKVFISIYCKIYNDTFSNDMFNRKATGKQIYEFLMKDSQHCLDDNGKIIPGDCNLWYLGCNEKFGELVLEDKVWKWSFGESSFDNIQAFVSMLYEKDIISKQQYQALMDKIVSDVIHIVYQAAFRDLIH